MEVLAGSRDTIAFHCFCMAPEIADRRAEVQEVVRTMADDPKGRPILESLDFSGFEALDEGSLGTLQTLMAYYGETT